MGTAAGDFDADGVTDPLDDCPTVAAVATVNGCPARPAKLVDTDHDGIPDKDGQGNAIDKCPNFAPAPGTDADGDGCTDPVVTPTPRLRRRRRSNKRAAEIPRRRWSR